MTDTIQILPGRPPAVLLVRFIAESTLDYPRVDGIDGRLHLWQQQLGCWAVAFLDRQAAGVACIAAIDAGRYAGATCLYWLEVLPAAQRQGVGRSLLHWACAQTERLLIVATPGAVAFYAHTLPGARRDQHVFVVEQARSILASAPGPRLLRRPSEDEPIPRDP